jgi:hypothetical protein
MLTPAIVFLLFPPFLFIPPYPTIMLIAAVPYIALLVVYIIIKIEIKIRRSAWLRDD